jgi:hypothetical protein
VTQPTSPPEPKKPSEKRDDEITREDFIEYITALLRTKTLDPKAAVEAAWNHGWKLANATYTARQNDTQLAMQQQSAQGNFYAGLRGREFGR